MGYNDMLQHLRILEESGLLIEVKRPINKDTELHPLVRWQYRGGIPEEGRKAFLFRNVTDSKGRQYSLPVTVGALAGSTDIYCKGLGCKRTEILEVWDRALSHLIKPEIVASGPVQEVVWQGDELEKEGLAMLPIPISTPGFDNAPYTTCSHWLTRDPETGIRNLGNYRGQIKGRRRVGLYPSGHRQHIMLHWDKCQKKGIPLQTALIIGAPPVVSYAAVQKVPFGIDELAVAGGLAGEPIRLVRCKTVDLEVPAEAEVVIEGVMSTEYLELEGPFGESHGYVHPRRYNPFMEVTAITLRSNAILVSFISQVTPSESSAIKRSAYEALFLKHLRDSVGIKSVVRVVMHEPLTNLRRVIVIQMRNPRKPDVWRALHSAIGFHEGVGTIVVAIDEDIDPENADAILWALSYRMKPHKDVEIVGGLIKGHGPPFGGASQTEDMATEQEAANESALLIDATLKEPFPPISLPKREYMERARKIWEELGLPTLRPQTPWFGYSLGQWDEELDKEALLAAESDYWVTGEKIARQRRKVNL